MKCWNLAFNAQGSKLIIVVVHLGAVKISVAAAEALRRKERHDKTQFPTKFDGFMSFTPPPWMLMYFFADFFLISPCMWPNSGFWCCVFLTLQITVLYFLMEFSIKLGGFRNRVVDAYIVVSPSHYIHKPPPKLLQTSNSKPQKPT